MAYPYSKMLSRALYSLLGLLLGFDVYANACNKQDTINTLATAAYHEARGEGEVGMRAVMEVILVRVDSWRWPNTVCEVVYQGPRDANRDPRGCAFSYLCDGKTILATTNIKKYQIAEKIAQEMINGGFHYSITNHSDHYAVCKVLDFVSWDDNMEHTVRIGEHCFLIGRFTFN